MGQRKNQIGKIGLAYRAYAMMDHSRSLGGLGKPIMCNETKKIFNSITDCSTEMGLPVSSISNHLREKKYFETVRGFTFKYL